MTCTETYKERIMYIFHGFCKIVIRNVAIKKYAKARPPQMAHYHMRRSAIFPDRPGGLYSFILSSVSRKFQ